MPISKRDRLATLLSAGGLLRILEMLARRPCLLVINYHRVGSCACNRFDDGVFTATADTLRVQLRYLSANFEILGRDELVGAADRGFALKRAAVVITFDDGYLDNYALAFPILCDLGVPAFFFIPTEYVDHPRLPWWDRIAYIVKNTHADRLRLEEPHRFEVELGRLGRDRAIREVLRFFKTADDFEESAFFDHLEDQAAVAVDAEALGRELFVSWDQIREMRAAGMVIGSHTHSHRILARLPEANQRNELAVSKARLEAELGESVDTIAYPVGSPRAFSEATKRLARDVGFRVGFSQYGGINRPGRTDPFDVRRIAVDRSNTFPLFRTRAILHNLAGRSL
jgi:peptidoglycan/xylan/chitin deacetylase (PgdA/CDA1 family)